MKNKLKKTIMGKMNYWIEKIKEAVRIAMNKGLYIRYYTSEYREIHHEIIWINKGENNSKYIIKIIKDEIDIITPTGFSEIAYSITDRDDLELRALGISIKEYNKDMAISEFEEFISEKKEEITDINNLDDDD